MRWPIAYAVFKKEVLETLRDRRTLVVMLLLPLLLYPLLMVVMTQLFTHQMAEIEKQTARVLVHGSTPDSLKSLYDEVDGLTFESVPPDRLMPVHIAVREPVVGDSENPWEHREPVENPESRDWARDQLQNGRAHVVVILPDDLAQTLDAGGSAGVLIYYDETNHVSSVAVNRVHQLMARWERRIRESRDAAQNKHGYTDPLVPELYNTASAEERGGFVAGQVLPVLLMIMVMLGAFYPAIDLTAGEKERGTMQTLMTAPAEAVEIIVGKFLTVVVVSLISAVANIVSMAAAFMWILGATGGERLALTVDLPTILVVFAQLLPIAIFFSAIMLAIAVFAQSFKEAQNYLSPAYMLVIFPAFMGAMPGAELTQLTAAVPGLNFVLLIRGLLMGDPSFELIGMVLLANVIYAMLAIALAVRIFQNEEVLLGGSTRGTFLDIFRTRVQGQLTATPVLSLAAFAVGMLLFLYLGTLFQKKDIVWGMIATQFALFALPVILWLKGFRISLADTLQLRAPRPSAWIGALLIGISAWASVAVLITWLQSFFIPENPALEEMMRDQLGMGDGSISLPVMLLAFAVSPGICEELFFRGLILGGFRRHLSKWTAIGLCGLLFGLLHISLERILPTGLLGVLLAFVAIQTRSLWPCILIHILHNGSALVAVHFRWFQDADGATDVPPLLIVGASITFLIGLAIILSSRPQTADSLAADP